MDVECYIVLFCFQTYEREANMMSYKFALSLILGIQMALFIFIVLSVHSAERFKVEVEALTMKKLWPELIEHLTIQRTLFAVSNSLEFIRKKFIVSMNIE